MTLHVPAQGMPVALKGPHGQVHALYHPVQGARAAVIWVGGTDGGVTGPADAIYPTLAADLIAEGIASLRVAFRVLGSPGNVQEAVHDVLGGVAFLKERGVRRVGLVGHSFGGAVVIETAARSQDAAAVVTLATQTAGAERVREVSPRPLLLVHGDQDIRLPPWCSQHLYARALQPKQLVLLPGARHSLRQRRSELRALLHRWLKDHLAPQRP